MSETTQINDAHPPKLDAHFIPIRKSDLQHVLTDDPDLSTGDKAKLFYLYELLEATIHYEQLARIEKLKKTYGPFDPDAVTKDVRPVTSNRETYVKSLFSEFEQVLVQANYARLDRHEIDTAVKALSHFGVRDDETCSIKRIEVFARGHRTMPVEHPRSWSRRPIHRETEVHDRLVVIFRLEDTTVPEDSPQRDRVYIKIFKDVPKSSVDCTFPNWQARMPLMVLIAILLPLIVGASVTRFDLRESELALVGGYGVFALLGIAFSVFLYVAYERKKENYQTYRSKNLYLNNLVNNVGVLLRLLDDAEEQEFREAILAYFLLWQKAPVRGWSKQELDEAVEEYLRNSFRVETDFEVEDAVGKLERFDMVKSMPNNRFRAVEIDDALIWLDKKWDDYFPFYNEFKRRKVEEQGLSGKLI